jgi:3-hydroxyacyl-CoA dehydrogenase / enoyl-CoA hydratase / 3-hydroxybutyryl-CoA epimerase
MFNYEKDENNIVTVTMDMTGRVNAMNAEYEQLMSDTIDRLEKEKEDISGVVLTSAKSTFFAGGDLKTLVAVEKENIEEFFDANMKIKSMLRRMEQLGRPVVAAINGAALGGGFEICLACHHRIAIDNPKTQLGLPEVTLGLLPGGGGVVRLVSKIGAEKAFPFLLQGKKLKPQQALEANLIEELAADNDDLISKAKDWITNNPNAQNPWDVKGYKIPGGTITRPNIVSMVQGAIPMLFKETKGLLPAPKAILDVMATTLRLDFDTAIRVEGRELCRLVLTPEAKNIISTFFFQMNKLNSGASRPKDIEKTQVKKVGVIGAGMMGQGIAYVTAKAGINVILKDMSIEAAEKGKKYTQDLLEKAVSRGRMTEDKKEKTLSLIKPTVDNNDLSGCDLIIEAVFESVELKNSVTKESEPMLDKDGFWGTNTSSLPIGLLSQASGKPENFIGIHFFSPVDKMPLVEIITGEKTSDETLARAFDYVQSIKKVPIVVNDSRGFFTSRVFGTYVDEGAQLLEDGVDPVVIENLARQVGMPVGPLAVHDEVSQQLTVKISDTNNELDKELGKPMIEGRIASYDTAQLLISKNRQGKAYGGGYYDYHESGEKTLWPEIYNVWGGDNPKNISDQDIKDRIIFRQVLESIRCYEEDVLNSYADANIGSVMGIGFPAHLGGVFQFMNTYGVNKFLQRSKELHEKYGEHFEPPELLIKTANNQQLFV